MQRAPFEPNAIALEGLLLLVGLVLLIPSGGPGG
jgi:hypothetical protein